MIANAQAKKFKKGFTLVELIVVIAIIAILSTVAVVGYSAFIDHAKQASAKAERDQLVSVARAYEAFKTSDEITNGTNTFEIVFDGVKTFTVKKNENTVDVEEMVLYYFLTALGTDTGLTLAQANFTVNAITDNIDYVSSGGYTLENAFIVA